MTLKGVILDIDGTLIDSNGAHAQAWVEALAEHGYEVSPERVRRLIGMGGDKLLPEVTGLAQDTPQGRQISERRREIFMEQYLPGIRPLPGTRALLERLREQGLVLAVATSAEQAEVAGLLAAAQVADLLPTRTTSSDARNSKPDPDIVEVALQRLGEPAGVALMIGDTPYDVQAALRAGIPIIALRSGGWQDEDLRGAAAVYDDPADLLAHLEASPLRDGQE